VRIHATEPIFRKYRDETPSLFAFFLARASQYTLPVSWEVLTTYTWSVDEMQEGVLNLVFLFKHISRYQ